MIYIRVYWCSKLKRCSCTLPLVMLNNFHKVTITLLISITKVTMILWNCYRENLLQTHWDSLISGAAKNTFYHHRYCFVSYMKTLVLRMIYYSTNSDTRPSGDPASAVSWRGNETFANLGKYRLCNNCVIMIIRLTTRQLLIIYDYFCFQMNTNLFNNISISC